MENEDPHLPKLNKMDIWVQVYDLYDVLKGCLSEKILQSIGNFVGTFVKSDLANLDGFWKPFARIRIMMDIEKPLKRRMKIKHDGDSWSWINFKYERLSIFCFVCGMLDHSERDCAIVYANPDKEFDRTYGVWLRAPNRNAGNKNSGARWLRNGPEGGGLWASNTGGVSSTAAMNGGDKVGTNSMEVDDISREILGGEGAIQIVERNQGGSSYG